MVTSSEVVGSSAIRTLRVAGDADCADHALAHAAGELVRIVANADFRRGDANLAEHVHNLVTQSVAFHVAVNFQRLANLVVDVEHRVERGHRVLQHHSDAVPANLLHLFLIDLENILAAEMHLSAHDVSRRRGH